ncbi:MAG TPA: hypothetical protein VGK58_19290 [Lacipirellulaceae bacterium]
MLKYLRIAVTALSLMACVLLIGLWARSYSAIETAQAHVFGKWLVHVQSARGNVLVFTIPQKYLNLVKASGISPSRFSRVSYADIKRWNEFETAIARPDERSIVFMVPDRRICHFPYYAAVLFSAAIACTPWVPLSRRFSLRTLLIATTLVAVGLGVIAVSL